MSITSIGTINPTVMQSVTSMENQLSTLETQLGTGQKSTTYSGLGPQSGVTIGLDAQLAAISGYNDTITNVTTRLDIAQQVLTQIASVGSTVKQTAQTQTSFSIDNTGQTSAQESATSQLDQVLTLLNTQAGDRYLFSGSGVTQASVDTTDHILNGNGAQAGLKQIIAERNQADLGADGLGRLVIPAAAGSTVSVSEDVAGSPFGLKLANVTSTLTGATVTGPTGSPAAINVDLGATNPNDGDSITFTFNLPDGTTQNLTLQATTSTTPAAGQFTIGATPAATATNLQAALTAGVSQIAQTSLSAASAVAAANNFFSSNPPQRVAGPPFNTATALTNGTSADTVMWYTGENGPTPARSTAVAQVGPSTSVSYGVRANEQGISSLVANIAVMAAMTFSPSDTNASARYAALTQRVGTNLAGSQGTQSVQDIEADLANAQTVVGNATTNNQQTQSTLTDMLQQIEGVSTDQIGAQILTLQTSLQASLSTTARLSQISLVDYLK